ncbi:hypothetical protein [Spirosoma validum]|uniref:Uncharacterized protein n=1 Tax=Spirosoma validum TaxID=2771355 RepID=A0A927B4R7_9BACT|nr:hypothetical protein [Spirosoma validum]MBD2755369.1 hypothetical protein [Spirosoma validum]
MKRKIVLFTVSILLLRLTGCKKNETAVTPDDPLPQFSRQTASKINEISYESAKVTIAVSGTGTSPLKSFGLVYFETETQPKISAGSREEYTVPVGSVNPKHHSRS